MDSNHQASYITPFILLRSSGQIPRRLRRLKDQSSARIPRLSEAKVERKREGLPRGILFDLIQLLNGVEWVSGMALNRQGVLIPIYCAVFVCSQAYSLPKPLICVNFTILFVIETPFLKIAMIEDRRAPAVPL
jgi:hypothetical protein